MAMYLSVRARPISMAGVDWLLNNGPVAMGADVGIEWALMTAITASYHLFHRQQKSTTCSLRAGTR